MESESAASEPSRTGALSWPDFLPFSLYPDSPGIYVRDPSPSKGQRGRRPWKGTAVWKSRGERESYKLGNHKPSPETPSWLLSKPT